VEGDICVVVVRAVVVVERKGGQEGKVVNTRKRERRHVSLREREVRRV
jgi:hypothetical protein